MSEPGAPGIEPDAWLARLFGYPVFRVSSTTGHAPDAAVLRDALPAGDAFLFARLPASNVTAMHQYTDLGFRAVDLTLRFTRAPGGSGAPAPELCVREARGADWDGVLGIAESAFRYSRFHLDPLVPAPVANAIKRAWMQSYRDGTRGAGCLVALRKGANGERVAGFLGRVEAKRGGNVAHVIDLIAVDGASQGIGVGRALVEAFVQAAAGRATEVEVGTQAANVPSVRLYEACGFRLADASWVMHGHFRDRVAQS